MLYTSRVAPQDREALDGQQDQQHRPGHRGQPLVAPGPAEPHSTLSRLRLLGSLWWLGSPVGALRIRPVPLFPYWSGYDTFER
jgi:hypothetical protein